MLLEGVLEGGIGKELMFEAPNTQSIRSLVSDEMFRGIETSLKQYGWARADLPNGGYIEVHPKSPLSRERRKYRIRATKSGMVRWADSIEEVLPIFYPQEDVPTVREVFRQFVKGPLSERGTVRLDHLILTDEEFQHPHMEMGSLKWAVSSGAL